MKTINFSLTEQEATMLEFALDHLLTHIANNDASVRPELKPTLLRVQRRVEHARVQD